MTISFNHISVNVLTPGVYVEFDNSNAVRGLPVLPYKVLIIGQRLAAGAVAENIPTKISSVNEAVSAFGRASMLHGMVLAYRQNNQYTETWCVALDDEVAAVAATGKIAFTGPATAAGTVYLYIAGRQVLVTVAAADTADDVATAVAAAITADLDLPVTAVVNGVNTHEVDITARNKGAAGNDIDIRINYQQGEAYPTGVGSTITAMASGATNPDIAAVITAMGDEWYNVIVTPFTDATNLTALETELADRWGPSRQIEGHAIAAADGDQAAMSALGDGRSSPHLSIVAANDSPTPPYEVAAMAGGVVAHYGNIDPAKPLQTLPLSGMLPPGITSKFTRAQRNTILGDGISTYIVDSGGVCRVERIVTTYTQNAQALPDASFRDIQILLTLGKLRFDVRSTFINKYGRHKLGADGQRYGSGQDVMTPKIAKGICYNLFREWEEAGLVEDFDQFKEELLVEINGSDPNRLDIFLPPNLINQLRVTAVQVGFIV